MVKQAFMLLLICSYALMSLASGSTSWSYQDQQAWPSVCGLGVRQSPVNINFLDKSVVHDEKLKNLDFKGFSSIPPKALSIANTGNNLAVAVDPNFKLAIEGGDLSSSYDVVNFNFHWGLRNEYGSDHSINGKFFPLEMHITASKSSMKLKDALKSNDNDSLAQFAVFFSLGDHNQELQLILDNVKPFGQRSNIDLSLNLARFLPKDAAKEYLTYTGSLTAPPCSENVKWFVFRNLLTVSHRQLALLRQLIGANGMPLSNTFRGVQPLNDRIIRASFRYLQQRLPLALPHVDQKQARRLNMLSHIVPTATMNAAVPTTVQGSAPEGIHTISDVPSHFNIQKVPVPVVPHRVHLLRRHVLAQQGLNYGRRHLLRRSIACPECVQFTPVVIAGRRAQSPLMNMRATKQQQKQQQANQKPATPAAAAAKKASLMETSTHANELDEMTATLKEYHSEMASATDEATVDPQVQAEEDMLKAIEEQADAAIAAEMSASGSSFIETSPIPAIIAENPLTPPAPKTKQEEHKTKCIKCNIKHNSYKNTISFDEPKKESTPYVMKWVDAVLKDVDDVYTNNTHPVVPSDKNAYEQTPAEIAAKKALPPVVDTFHAATGTRRAFYNTPSPAYVPFFAKHTPVQFNLPAGKGVETVDPVLEAANAPVSIDYIAGLPAIQTQVSTSLIDTAVHVDGVHPESPAALYAREMSKLNTALHIQEEAHDENMQNSLSELQSAIEANVSPKQAKKAAKNFDTYLKDFDGRVGDLVKFQAMRLKMQGSNYGVPAYNLNLHGLALENARESTMTRQLDELLAKSEKLTKFDKSVKSLTKPSNKDYVGFIRSSIKAKIADLKDIIRQVRALHTAENEYRNAKLNRLSSEDYANRKAATMSDPSITALLKELKDVRATRKTQIDKLLQLELVKHSLDVNFFKKNTWLPSNVPGKVGRKVAVVQGGVKKAATPVAPAKPAARAPVAPAKPAPAKPAAPKSNFVEAEAVTEMEAVDVNEKFENNAAFAELDAVVENFENQPFY